MGKRGDECFLFERNNISFGLVFKKGEGIIIFWFENVVKYKRKYGYVGCF